VVAINKMDLVDYSEEVYNKIKSRLPGIKQSTFKEKPELHSWLHNKAAEMLLKSADMPWYDGLLDLEALEKPADVYERDKRVFLFKLWLDPKRQNTKGICRKYMVII
jgi:sulfate adenylyltransferase subunit 1